MSDPTEGVRYIDPGPPDPAMTAYVEWLENQIRGGSPRIIPRTRGKVTGETEPCIRKSTVE